MKAIDFSKVLVEYRIGEPEEMDVRRSVANEINQHTADIGLADFARKIYYSKEPVEIPEEYVDKIVLIVTHSSTIIAAAKTAVTTLIRESFEIVPGGTLENNVEPHKTEEK